MDNDKYYNKAMKLIDNDKDKALSILEKGASKYELKSIMKLIDIKIEDFVSEPFYVSLASLLESMHPYKPNKLLLESTLSINKLLIFNLPYETTEEDSNEKIKTLDEITNEIANYLEMAITKDKSLTYDLGCLYTCMAFCCSYEVIEAVSNGEPKEPDPLRRQPIIYSIKPNTLYLKKAFNIFEKNLDDVRNIEMYLGYIWSFWSKLNFKKKFNSGKNQVLIDELKKFRSKGNYIEKTNYLRMPMKIYYFKAKDYEEAEKMARKLLEKTGDNESKDSWAAHYVLDKIAKSRGKFSKEDRIKSRKFGYKESAQMDDEFGLLNSIHYLYEEIELSFVTGFADRSELEEKDKSIYDKLFSRDEKDIINIIKENNKPAFKDCLWEYYALKYIDTKDLNYYVKFIDEYIRRYTDRGRTKYNYLIKADMFDYLFNSKDEYLLKKAIEYSKYYDDFTKINDSLDYDYSYFRVIVLRAIYEYKNKGIVNDVIKKFLIDGLYENNSSYIYDADDIFDDKIPPFEDIYNFDKFNLIEDKSLNKLKQEYDTDGDKYEFRMVSEAEDKLSSLSKLAIKKYSKDINDEFGDVVNLASKDNFLSIFKPLSEFDLNDCDKDEFYLFSYDFEKKKWSKKKTVIISNGVKDIIFDCLLNIYKNENNLKELRKALLKHKDRIRTKEYLIRIDNELNALSNDDKIISKLDELKVGQKEIKGDVRENLEITNKINDKVDFVISLFEDLDSEIKDVKKGIDDSNKTEEYINEKCNDIKEKFIEKIDELKGKLKEQKYDEIYNEREAEVINAFGSEYAHEYEMLEANSKKMLTSAYLAFYYLEKIANNKVDYSGPCVAISKVVELELKKRFYTQYTDYKKAHHISDPGCNRWEYINTGTIEKPHIIKLAKDFTLGSIAYLTGYTKNNHPIEANENFKTYIESQNILKEEIDPVIALREIGDGCNKITNDYRNVSAHTNPVDKDLAKECKEYIVESTKFLASTLHKFRNL